jgi:hypothetical protein
LAGKINHKLAAFSFRFGKFSLPLQNVGEIIHSKIILAVGPISFLSPGNRDHLSLEPAPL